VSNFTAIPINRGGSSGIPYNNKAFCLEAPQKREIWPSVSAHCRKMTRKIISFGSHFKWAMCRDI